MRGQALLLALCLTAISPAAAQDFDCTKTDDLPQAGLTYCAGVEYDEADKTLNVLWPKIVAEAKRRDADSADYIKDLGVPTNLETLRAAQRAWIEFRDRQCELESYEMLGGTAQPMVGLGCQAAMTRARTEDLKNLYPDN